MGLLLPKTEIIRDRRYLDAQRHMASIITGLRGDTVCAAHLGSLGRGIKRSDDESLPIEHHFHIGVGHQKGEPTMWRTHLPDYVLMAALRLYAKAQYQEWLAENPKRSLTMAG